MITAHDLARIHVFYYNGDAKRTKGTYRQRIQKAWGHTAHRGWARLLLNRARDLIIHGPAHRKQEPSHAKDEALPHFLLVVPIEESWPPRVVFTACPPAWSGPSAAAAAAGATGR